MVLGRQKFFFACMRVCVCVFVWWIQKQKQNKKKFFWRILKLVRYRRRQFYCNTQSDLDTKKQIFRFLILFYKASDPKSFFFCYKYRIKHIIYHHRTTLFVKFSRFASFLFLFCCSHVFILVFVDFWIRFWLSIFRAVKKALKIRSGKGSNSSSELLQKKKCGKICAEFIPTLNSSKSLLVTCFTVM